MRRANKEQVRRLALLDPTVAAHLEAQAAPSSGIGWEEMLMSLVCRLVEDKAALRALVELHEVRQRLSGYMQNNH